MKRSAPLRRTSPPRKRNAARKAREFRRAYHSAARVEWVSCLRCVVSRVHTSDIQNAHVRGGGASRKADYIWIVPLDKVLHDELHRIGKRSFERKFNVDLDALAVATEAAWQAHQETSK